jgi:hypothetical protein
VPSVVDYIEVNGETRRLAGVVIELVPPSPEEIERALAEARAILDGDGLLSEREARARATADVAYVRALSEPPEPEDSWTESVGQLGHLSDSELETLEQMLASARAKTIEELKPRQIEAEPETVAASKTG